MPVLRRGALREACAVATGGSWREILMDEAVAGGCGWVCGWRLWVGAWLGLLWWRGWRLRVGARGELRP